MPHKDLKPGSREEPSTASKRGVTKRPSEVSANEVWVEDEEMIAAILRRNPATNRAEVIEMLRAFGG